MLDLNSILIFDIETEPNQAALELIPEPKAPKNYKDAEKIKEYLASKKAELVANAALDPDLGRIAAIGWRRGLDGENEVMLVGDIDCPNEVELLRDFWKAFHSAAGMCCGYNIAQFDLPFILRRSFDLGVQPSQLPDLRRFANGQQTLDLYTLLYNGQQGNSLKWVCKRYGIPNPLPDLEGSMFAGMDRDTRRAYLHNDVELTAQLLDKMNGIYL